LLRAARNDNEVRRHSRSRVDPANIGGSLDPTVKDLGAVRETRDCRPAGLAI
jgi:hypothetical protein